ncbi:MAG: NUDIX domain-containing protein [Symploca sp. SIO2B6]|nr:NUDIX domain-containing protein [Symploca sp. SIO2B6]
MIDAIAWIYIQDQKLLCVRTKGKDAFYLPGGKRELGESDEATLVREIREELNVILQPNTIRWFQVYEADAHGYQPGTQVRLTCYRADFSGTMQPSGEIAELAWIESGEGDRCAPVNQVVINDLRRQGLIQ